MLGKPVITGTRIMVELIVRKLGDGATVEDLLDGYPNLKRDDVQAALIYGAESCDFAVVRCLRAAAYDVEAIMEIASGESDANIIKMAVSSDCH